MEHDDKDEAGNDGERGVDRVDDKHHGQSPNHTNECRFCRKVFECGSKIGR